MSVTDVWHEGGHHVQRPPPINVDQDEGCSAGGEAGQRCVPDSLQLWQSLHWQDQAEAGNQAEGTPGCMPNPVCAEVCVGRAHQGEPPSHQLEEHIGD